MRKIRIFCLSKGTRLIDRSRKMIRSRRKYERKMKRRGNEYGRGVWVNEIRRVNKKKKRKRKETKKENETEKK